MTIHLSNAEKIAVLEQQRAQILAQSSGIGDLRPGSLVERYRRCGKPTCHCAAEDSRGHGPSFSLTHKVDGKTITRVVPAGLVARTQQQIAEYRHL